MNSDSNFVLIMFFLMLLLPVVYVIYSLATNGINDFTRGFLIAVVIITLYCISGDYVKYKNELDHENYRNSKSTLNQY